MTAFSHQTDALQPFIRLAQANMELFSRHAWSPEVANEAMQGMQALVEQSQQSFARLAQSQAFVELAQGLMRNYTEFLGEVTQSAYALMSQGPAAFMQQAMEAGTNVVEMTTRARRGR